MITSCFKEPKNQSVQQTCPRCNQDLSEYKMQVCSCGYTVKIGGHLSFFCLYDTNKKTFHNISHHEKILYKEA